MANFRHCAPIVGNAMVFIPTRDIAIYAVLLRMSERVAVRYPLVDLQGSIGDFDNPPKAMRYTKAKLSRFAHDCIASESVVTGFEVFEPKENQYILFVTSDGFAKRIPIHSFELKQLGSPEDFAFTDLNEAAHVCGSVLVIPGQKIRARTLNYLDFDFEVDDVPVMEKSSRGVRLHRLRINEPIHSICLIVEHGDEDEADDN